MSPLPATEPQTAETRSLRLAHYLALAGVCSRRQAARLIEAGQVTVDGVLGQHAQRIARKSPQVVRVNGKRVQLQQHAIYWLYHKPVGVDCRLLIDDASSLLHRLPTVCHCYPAGRLDKDSRGLLLITNDGELTQRLMHPDFDHQKRYLVSVDKPLTAEFLQAMATGMNYGDGLTRPCQLQQTDTQQFVITLTEGKKRQIRRMCRHLGYRVTDLLRTEIGALSLGALAEGCFRALTAAELEQLDALKLTASSNPNT